MTSTAEFVTHDAPHVLPADADPEEARNLVPAEEFPGEVQGIKPADPDGDDDDHALGVEATAAAPVQAVTDGGQVEPDDDSENVFTCPSTGCGAEVRGYPTECPECGAAYNWPETEVSA